MARLSVLCASTLVAAEAGCTDGGNGGCGHPVGEKWDTWSMRASTYTYCYGGCVVDWLLNNTDALQLNKYAGVVGVDHYWTHQGMPCIDGQPQEFGLQDALAQKWKATFPDLRFLHYRILSAVPYDMVVQNKINSDPDAVVRWRHQPGSSAPANGSVCYNYLSGCFNDPSRINNPANKCNFPIRAAAYNWSNAKLGDWFLEEVIKPSLRYGDGIWLDGIGPDNGAYMCSGVCCGFGAANSPLLQPEIDSHCDAQAAATTQAQKWLIANGGWEAMRCFDYLTRVSSEEEASEGTPASASDLTLPAAHQSPSECAKNLQAVAEWAADHRNYNHVVAYGARTGGRTGYDDTSVAGTVAAFMLMRGQHWLFSIGPNGGRVPKHPSDPHDEELIGSLVPATAKVLTSDYGRPLGNMTAVAGKQNVFERKYQKATVTLDCSTFTPTFEEQNNV